MSINPTYLCDPEEVALMAAAYYGRPFGSKDAVVLAQTRRAAGRFRDELRHPLTLERDVVLTLDGTGTRRFQIPRLRPVVAKVTIGGRDLQPIGVSPHGIIQMAERTPRDLGAITVHLTQCGLEKVPEGVRTAVESMAIQYIGQIPGIQVQSANGVQLNPGATGTQGSREEWTNAIRTWGIGQGDRA